jgi:hypothetical protein
MVVGVFHMSNPGRDLHNAKIDDMLAPKRQHEIAQAVSGFERFKPTVVAVEWDAERATKDYEKYLGGTLAPSTNEVVQLGFRLARAAGLSTVRGVDASGDFPYDAVEAYAKAHGQSELLRTASQEIEQLVRRLDQAVAGGTVASALRMLNDPVRLATDNGFYRTTLKVGAGLEQPGVDLLTAWYRRNFQICANVIQLAKPGDRIVIFYGSGHAFLLRQCFQETPGFVLVEPNDFLPR